MDAKGGGLMNHVLMLGGAGFLGANLSRVLLEEGYRVSILERPGSDYGRLTDILPSLTIHEVSLLETERIRDLMATNGVDCVIHLASSLLPSSPLAALEAELQELVDPTLRLFDFCADLGVRVVFFSSGGTVYGKSVRDCFRESDPRTPINFYGYSKVLLEDAIVLLHQMKGLQFLILRPSNPYGRFQSLGGGQGFISVAMGKVLSNEPIDIWGDGSVVRDYLYVEDLARAVRDLLSRDIQGDTFNIGSGVGHSLLEVVAVIEETLGKKAAITFRAGRAVDVHRAVLNVEKLKRHIPYAPRDLHEGVLNHFHWLRAQRG